MKANFPNGKCNQAKEGKGHEQERTGVFFGKLNDIVEGE